VTSKTKEITFSYSDRTFRVKPSYPDEIHIEIQSTHADGLRQFGYANREEGLEIAQAIIDGLSLTQDEVFPKPEKVEPEPRTFAVARRDFKGNSWEKAALRSGKTPEQAAKRGRDQIRFWRREVEMVEGAQWLAAFDAEFGDGAEPKPKNAREVIEKLPVGATFTLDAGTEPTRYFRKRDETIIVDEYSDDRFEVTTKYEWNLTSYTGLFTGWSVDSLKLAEPRKTPTNQEIWEGMKRGDTFHFSDHPEKTHIKLSDRTYDHDGLGSNSIGSHVYASALYTIVPKEESK
jgi:hypothetical protein